jgi:hypothetical protein
VARTSTSSSSSSSSSSSTSSTAVVETEPTSTLVGQGVAGNRVIVIGDSVMASTSQRYGGTMCAALVPLGWQVEVDAESGRFIEFGTAVVKERLPAGWDAAVILLGNNYNGDENNYRWKLSQMVDQLSPRPVVLLTVTEFRPDRATVNAVIRDVASTRPNVTILDWAARTQGATDLLGADGLHLSGPGRDELAAQVAGVLGAAPAEPGQCLKTSYTDDSSGPPVGTVRPTPTTVRRVTPTTRRPTSSTNPPTATTARPPTATSSPPRTEPPEPTPTKPPAPTQPPATQPPATQPPATRPPATHPPVTTPAPNPGT